MQTAPPNLLSFFGPTSVGSSHNTQNPHIKRSTTPKISKPVLCLRVAAGADKRRMPNGARTAEKSKSCIDKDFARKTRKPEKAKSQAKTQKVEQYGKSKGREKSKSAARREKKMTTAKCRKV